MKPPHRLVLLTLGLAAGICATTCVPAAGTGSRRAVAPAAATGPGTSASPVFTLSSPAVRDGRLLPEYRCERKVNGVEDSIPLSWSNVPRSARSLAIVMHHYPFPGDTTRVSSYLLLWGIDPSVTGISHGGADAGGWSMGANKDGTAVSYTSPCSQGPGEHEYTITLFALSETPPTLPSHSTRDVTLDVLMKAVSTVEVLDTATLTFVDTTP